MTGFVEGAFCGDRAVIHSNHGSPFSPALTVALLDMIVRAFLSVLGALMLRRVVLAATAAFASLGSVVTPAYAGDQAAEILLN